MMIGRSSSAASSVTAGKAAACHRWVSTLVGQHAHQSHQRTHASSSWAGWLWSTPHQQRQKRVEYQKQLALRWEKNIARLYGRFVLLVAAARAASQVHKAQLEDAIMKRETKRIRKPKEWLNWERKDWTEDLMNSIGSNRFQRLMSATARIAELTLLWSPMVVLYPLSFVHERMSSIAWNYARWGIEKSGPFALKLTQWATTRQDLFSPEFCVFFGKLRDNTLGHAWHHTQRIIQEELGDLASYLKMEKVPIGSGCIAQVYRGTLTKSVNQYPIGTEVAIKVEHPGIWQKVCIDFYILGKIAGFMESIPSLSLTYLSLVDTVLQFRDIMLPQLDLTLEADHLTRFNRDFAGNDRVGFPEPIHGLTTVRVLTETFVKGVPILNYVNADENVRKDLANLGLNTTLKMIFLNDFLHGDLHPGNIMINEDDNGNTILNLLDCGLVVEMGPDQHVNLVKILGAFTRKNGRLAGQLMVDTSSNCQAGEFDVELFIRGIESIVTSDTDNNFIENVGEYITDICFLACRHKVKLEATFINAALAVEIMEGIATALNPNIAVAKVALPMVLQAEVMHRLPKFSLW